MQILEMTQSILFSPIYEKVRNELLEDVLLSMK